jgi:ribosomal protein L15E
MKIHRDGKRYEICSEQRSESRRGTRSFMLHGRKGRGYPTGGVPGDKERDERSLKAAREIFSSQAK